jgi:hypothetical protein
VSECDREAWIMKVLSHWGLLHHYIYICIYIYIYRVADKSLVLPGRKQATATEDFDVHISYL